MNRRDELEKVYTTENHPYKQLELFFKNKWPEFVSPIADQLSKKNADIVKIFDIPKMLPDYESRVKDFETLLDKFPRVRSPKTFAKAMQKLDDLLGLRLICKYPAHCEWFELRYVANYLIKDLECKPIDDGWKRTMDQVTGYKALHYTLLSGSKINKACGFAKDLLFEVQIKTQLQHYWAERAHYLIYKNKGLTGMPQPYQRFIHTEHVCLSRHLDVLDDSIQGIRKTIIDAGCLRT